MPVRLSSSLDSEKDPEVKVVSQTPDASDRNVERETSWTEELDESFLAEVRAELVQRYLDQGVPNDVAEKEGELRTVDETLCCRTSYYGTVEYFYL